VWQHGCLPGYVPSLSRLDGEWEQGHRVLVVEQTETPDQLERRRKETGSKDKVELISVFLLYTKNTCILDSQVINLHFCWCR
jgi:hypothetical protein